MSDDDWRKLPRNVRPYNSYRRMRYVEAGCDHNGPYCKCDSPYWLRQSTPAEEAHESAAQKHSEQQK